jgi:hypothetical protein
VAQTVFDAGTLLHKKRAADAAFDQAAAMYRSTVITAFQNVADALHAVQLDADTLKAAFAAERAAFKSLEIARRQLQLGAIGYLGLLTAENTYQTALLALVQAQAARFADTAALFQALGGGWWNREDVPPPKSVGYPAHSLMSSPPRRPQRTRKRRRSLKATTQQHQRALAPTIARLVPPTAVVFDVGAMPGNTPSSSHAPPIMGGSSLRAGERCPARSCGRSSGCADCRMWRRGADSARSSGSFGFGLSLLGKPSLRWHAVAE